MMTLFTKTYRKDFEWLALAAESLYRKCDDLCSPWVIVCDNGERADVLRIIEEAKKKGNGIYDCRVYEIGECWQDAEALPNGYLRQQWVKANAHRAIKDGYILFWDCDCIALKKFDFSSFCDNEKPVMYFTSYNDLIVGGGGEPILARRRLQGELFGLPEVAFEWMRTMPLWSHSEILRVGSTREEWRKFYGALKAGRPGASEFCVMGQLAHLYFPDTFVWRNTGTGWATWSGALDCVTCYTHQAWSYGGVKDEHRKAAGSNGLSIYDLLLETNDFAVFRNTLLKGDDSK